MSWFRVDDSFADHKKVESLEGDWQTHALAVAAWTLLGSDSARRELDGLVTPVRVAKILHCWPEKKREQACAALVAAGLWHVVEGGWQFHDWTHYQPTREEKDRERTAARERQKKWKARRRGDDGGGNASGNGVTNKVSDAVDNTAPSRPVPSRPVSSPSESESARAKPGDLENRVRARVSDALKAAGRPAPPLDTSSKCQRIAEWCGDHALATGQPIDDVIDALARGFASAAGKTAKAGWPLGYLAQNPGEYIRLAPSNPKLGGGETDDELLADLRRTA